MEISFVTDKPRRMHERLDIDNLVKPTLDALEGIFGVRETFGVRQCADDLVDELAAVKRVALPGETAGAHIVIHMRDDPDPWRLTRSRPAPVTHASDPFRVFFGASHVRRRILLHFATIPESEEHPRSLSRRLQLVPAVVARQLDRLEEAGVLVSRRIGVTRRYRVGESDFARTFIRWVRKTIGVEAVLRSLIEPVPGIEAALIFGSYAKGDERRWSDIDVLVIGDADPDAVRIRAREATEQLGRQVSTTVRRREDVSREIRSGDSAIRSVIRGRTISIFGDVSDYRAAARMPAHS